MRPTIKKYIYYIAKVNILWFKQLKNIWDQQLKNSCTWINQCWDLGL